MRDCNQMLLCIFLMWRFSASGKPLAKRNCTLVKTLDVFDAVPSEANRIQVAQARNGIVKSSKNSTYDYCGTSGKGPLTWHLTFPSHCSGKLQSPIDLPGTYSDDLNVMYGTPKLDWREYSQQPNSMNLTNNGKTIVLTGSWDNRPTISGGFLNGTFIFAQLHFHWGTKDDEGSEHTLDGVRYPLEIHAVHYRDDFGSLSEAKKYKGGVVVLGYMAKPNPPGIADDPSLSLFRGPLIDLLKVKNIAIAPFPLETIVRRFQDSYYFYHGSLTTPTCNEVVDWMVYIHPNNAPSIILTRFRLISKATTCMSQNFRPIQQRNDREIIFVDH